MLSVIYAECQNKHFIQSVIKLSAECRYAVCLMLSVVMLNVVVPIHTLNHSLVWTLRNKTTSTRIEASIVTNTQLKL
jgi:hypothetical protein